MYWKRRQDNFSNVLWLTIDKKSMLTTPNLLLLSKTIGVVRSGLQSTVPSIPLGGMSTILLGDFHQFPLISSKQNTLYCTSVVKDNPQLGRALYKQFDIVIKLEEQMRITDQVWVDILWQSQTGDCTGEDISEIKRLVLLNPGCEIPNCTESPWSNAVIVTPHNGVRMFWNEQMLQSQCCKMGQVHYIFYVHNKYNSMQVGRSSSICVIAAAASSPDATATLTPTSSRPWMVDPTWSTSPTNTTDQHSSDSSPGSATAFADPMGLFSDLELLW